MKTREEYSVLLTAEELCTLAGMLGRSWLFAVDGKTLRAWQSDVPHRVACAAERMERRGLLDFELNGTLRLRPELRQLMERLSKPERVLVHTGTSAGKHETTYYLGSGERWAVVTRPETDCYRLARYFAFKCTKVGERAEVKTYVESNGVLYHERSAGRVETVPRKSFLDEAAALVKGV